MTQLLNCQLSKLQSDPDVEKHGGGKTLQSQKMHKKSCLSKRFNRFLWLIYSRWEVLGAVQSVSDLLLLENIETPRKNNSTINPAFFFFVPFFF